jgi:putative autoinducer-2 (AI-2) aldolase
MGSFQSIEPDSQARHREGPLMLAVDHGYFLGPTSGLEEPPQDSGAAAAPYADSLMLTARCAAQLCVPPRRTCRSSCACPEARGILTELSAEG